MYTRTTMENEILKRKIEEIQKIGDKIDAPDWLIDDFIMPKGVIKRKIRVRVEGKHRLLQAIRVHHLNPHSTGASPYKGGFRLHPGVTEELLTVLAMDMTEKCVLADLQFGGAKGGIALDPLTCTEHELRDIIEKTTVEFLHSANIPHPDIDSFGPDVGMSSEAMYWMYNTIAEMNQLRSSMLNVPASVTGKPIRANGIPGREDATSHGLLIQLLRFLELTNSPLLKKEEIAVAVQGFGNVGSNIVFLSRDKRFARFKIVAVSDRRSGIYNPKGLDPSLLRKSRDGGGNLEGYSDGSRISNAELLELPVDILIPAAIENQITKENAPRIKAKLISEGANEAITSEAHQILSDKGIPVIPGIVANVGGVIVSYLEWSMNRGDRKHRVDFDEEKTWVTEELTRIMHDVIENVYARSLELSSSLSDAAHILAMERLRDLLKMKHSY